MRSNSKKHSFYILLLAILFGIFLLYLLLPRVFPEKLASQNSFAMIKTLYENNSLPADLGIEKVSLKKLSAPRDDFNYYKYKATLLVKNYGGNLINARVNLKASPDQKTDILSNNNDGDFTLLAGEKYIYKDYNVLLDGSYNGGDFDFYFDAVDGGDYYADNNSYHISVFENPAKISSLEIASFSPEKNIVLNFDAHDFFKLGDNIKIFVAENLPVNKDDLRYDEVVFAGKLFSYQRLRNDEKYLQYPTIYEDDVSGSPYTLDLSKIDAKKDFYIYLKAIDPNTGYFAVSNILKISPAHKLTRAEFVKQFANEVGMDVSDDMQIYFSDVPNDADFAPAVKSFISYGLLNLEDDLFKPNELMKREDALKIVMDYFDIDLSRSTQTAEYGDLTEKENSSPYFSIYRLASSSLKNLDFFLPDKPTTTIYLNFLIDVFSKTT